MDKIIKKSNKLILMPNVYTAIEQKFINQIILQVEKSYDKESVLLYKADFSEILSKKESSERFDVIFDGLCSKVINFIDSKEDEFDKMTVLGNAKLYKDDGLIEVGLSKKFSDFLFTANKSDNNERLKRLGFAELDLNSINNLKTKHDIKIYEVLKALSFANGKVSIEPLRLLYLLGQEQDGYYNSFYRLNDKILKNSIERINDTCKDLKIVSVTPIKNNRTKKLDKIEFITVKTNTPQPKIIVPVEVELKAKEELPQLVEDLILLGIKKSTALSMYKKDEKRIEAITNSVLINPKYQDKSFSEKQALIVGMFNKGVGSFITHEITDVNPPILTNKPIPAQINAPMAVGEIMDKAFTQQKPVPKHQFEKRSNTTIYQNESRIPQDDGSEQARKAYAKTQQMFKEQDKNRDDKIKSENSTYAPIWNKATNKKEILSEIKKQNFIAKRTKEIIDSLMQRDIIPYETLENTLKFLVIGVLKKGECVG